MTKWTMASFNDFNHKFGIKEGVCNEIDGDFINIFNDSSKFIEIIFTSYGLLLNKIPNYKFITP